MKYRAKTITLTLLATALMLGACDDDNKPEQMSSLESCIDKTGDTDVCKNAWNQAKQDYDKQAPKFKSVAECEAQFGPGKCNTVQTGSGSDSSSVIMPAMMGFMLGRMLDSGGNRVYSSQPYYGGSSNSFSTSKSAARPVMTSAGRPAIARGGFGSAGHSFSVGG